jgi:hypothetical protein
MALPVLLYFLYFREENRQLLTDLVQAQHSYQDLLRYYQSCIEIVITSAVKYVGMSCGRRLLCIPINIRNTIRGYFYSCVLHSVW